MVLASSPVDRVVPGIRRVTEPEQFYGLRRDAAFGQVIAGDLAARLAGQRPLPALGDLLMDLEELFLEGARLRLGPALPARRNSRCNSRTASGKSTLSYSRTNANTSPPLWQPKHLKICRRGLTLKLGLFSLWKGQSAVKFAPARFSGKYDPTTSTMSLAARICSRVAVEKSPAIKSKSEI